MSINQAVSNLWAWLETWLDEKGGVHGYVVHHHRDNLRFLSPDTWTQAPCILGSLRIYQKTKEKRWLELTTKLCDYLVNTYLGPLHLYHNSNHERKPLGKPGIIHNALPSYALLEVAKELKGQRKARKYHKIAKDNILNFLLQLRNESTGALTSIYHGKTAHIHNMNGAAILALKALSELEQDESYVENYARAIAKHILACQVMGGNQSGAYPYVDKEKNYRTLYSLITSIGLLELYKKTNASELLVSVKNLIENLMNFLDKETGLICHFHRVGYPQWVPDTLLFVLNARWLENNGITIPIDSAGVLSKVLSRQYEHGGFPLSIGFADLSYTKGLPSKPEIRRWRDLLPTPNWNAWNFWVLAELLPQRSHINEPTIKFPLVLETDEEGNEGPYEIIEDDRKVVFTSKREQRIVAIFDKTEDVSKFCLIRERGDFWRTLDSLSKYPGPLRRLILALPNMFV